MRVQEVVSALGLHVAAGAGALDREITAGYTSDLLSCVMAKARAGNIWVTLQAHPNVVAVASLLNLAAVVITEGMAPSEETIARAEEHGIPLLLSPKDSFTIVGRLAALGIRGNDESAA